MKCILFGVLVALLCATATAERNMHATLMTVPFPEVDKFINRYLKNVKCISGVVDQVLAKDDSIEWWNEFKASVIHQFQNDTKKCAAMQDAEEQLECKDKLIAHGIETAFQVPTKFVGSISWELTKTIRNKLVWKCFDVPALLSLLNQFRQLGVLGLLPEITAEYSVMFGEASKRNGNGVEWAKTETKLTPHLDKWNKCSEKSILLKAYCHLKEGTTSARIMADHILAIGESNAPMLVELIEECRQRWFLPPTTQ